MLKICFILLSFITILSCNTSKEKTFLQKVVESNSSIEEKVNAVLNEMTYEEKVSFINGSDWKIQGEVKRLGLPAIKIADSSVGVSLMGKATSFPASIISTASFNRDLVSKIGDAVAEECRARGVQVLLGPGVNIYRVHSCGRNWEYTGEDPYLAGEMAVEYIKSVQKRGVVPTIKHFCANNQDFDRHGTDAVIDERALHEIYLEPYRKSIVQSDVAAVMTSYNPVNGFPMTENKKIVVDILKNKWGFKGFTVSDWISSYSTEGMFTCGIDLEMPSSMPYFDLKNINNLDVPNKLALLDDKVKRILTSYFRIGVYDTPAVDENAKPYSKKNEDLSQLACEEGFVLLKNEDNILPLKKDVKQNIVLTGYNASFFNSTSVGAATILSTRDGRMLTIDPKSGFKPYNGRNTKIKRAPAFDKLTLKKADTVIYFAGLWVFGEGEANDRSFDMPKRIVDDIKSIAKVNKNLVVVLNFGCGVETESWINDVKAVIWTSFTGSRGDYALAKIVFGDVNPSGKSPFTWEKKWEDNPANAAQIKNPGKLVVWPRDTKYRIAPAVGVGRFLVFGGDPKILKSNNWEKFEGVPEVYDKMDHMEYLEGIYLGYRHYDTFNIKPQFAFGYGLSYTKFDFSNLRVSKNSFRENDKIFVTVTVKNVGDYDGSEVVQLYVHDRDSKLERPYKELKGFDKVYLKSGEAKDVTIELNKDAFHYYDDKISDWITEQGKFDILVGNSSDNILLEKSVDLVK